MVFFGHRSTFIVRHNFLIVFLIGRPPLTYHIMTITKGLTFSLYTTVENYWPSAIIPTPSVAVKSAHSGGNPWACKKDLRIVIRTGVRA